MKILIITNSLAGGGAESSMRLIHQSLRNNYYDVTLLCLNKLGDEELPEETVVLNRKWQTGLVGTVKNFIEFQSELKKIAPDFIIANCELPELYIALTPRKLRHLVCVEHTSKPWSGRRKLGFMVRCLLRIKSSFWVTVNEDQSRIWPTGQRAIYIPNPVEKPLLNFGFQESPKFVFVGRLRVEKGIRIILEAILETKQNISIFGDGVLASELKLKFGHIATFYGFVENPWQKIQSNQTIIVASDYEGDGLVVVEALLAGLPILLKDNVDLRRFNLSDNNYFFDLESIVSKIQTASVDPEAFRPTGEIRLKYLNARNPSAVTKLWENLINQKF